MPEQGAPAFGAGGPLRARPPNRFDRGEWAGAFGDLGTLIPFVVGYVGVLGMDPVGILLPLGVAMVICGWHYRTPVPVQPMKAVAAIAITQAAQNVVITPEAVVVATFATGCFWLLLGASGLAGRLADLVPASVTTGIVLGLGLGFILDSFAMMATRWEVAAAGLAGTLLLLKRRRSAAMPALLLYGFACSAWLEPNWAGTLTTVEFGFRLPMPTLPAPTWDALVAGILFLALPQIPLTLGNAVIAIRDENNRLFPERPVTARGIAISTGLMNLLGASLGGMPMCHGAGGMAGHVAFGARTGGALVILGTLVIVLATGFGPSVQALFGLLPVAVLGVILFVTGTQLALAGRRAGTGWRDRSVALAVAACAVWNVGVALLAGLILSRLLQWRT